VSIGLSIHTAPVSMRERLAVPEDKWEDAIKALCAYPHVEEAGILSTCNRMEIYVVRPRLEPAQTYVRRGMASAALRCAVTTPLLSPALTCDESSTSF